jgi:hypothetical protein
MKAFFIQFISLLFFSQFSFSQVSAIQSMKDRANTIDNLLEIRVTQLLPKLMKREKIDMWVLISREYNEDPILKTFLPSTWISARRRTILILNRTKNDSVEAFAVARYNVGKLFKKSWDKEKEPDQWKRLAEIIKEKKPKNIAINKSKHFALTDGITATEYEELIDILPENYKKRVVSAEKLALAWLETRVPEEMVIYRHLVKIAHDIIKEGFSSKVISPGITTSEDLVWWFRERVRELKLTTWFHPTIFIERDNQREHSHLSSFSNEQLKNLILPGDLVHVDFGISYLRMNSDTQQYAYILRENETDAPEYLKNALRRANRLQDIFTNRFKVGKTGNQILKESREASIKEGIKPSIYTHPIGYHGHAAGTTLGMWDSQDGVPVKGDYPLHANTAYSIELNATTFIKEWNKEIRIMLEEDAFFDGENVWYIDGRQTSFLLVLNKDKHLGH